MKNTYSLIDSGNFQKLEKIGDYLIVRPAPQAIWEPSLSKEEWDKIDAYFIRDSKGGGNWNYKNKKMSDSWKMQFLDFNVQIKLTGFGHFGLFPEQKDNLLWIQNQINSLNFKPNILNLFAYTGISTLACLKAGAFVTHVDASKPVVEWAKINSKLSNLASNDVKWIVEDVSKFVLREIKRGNTYDAIILDPPAFGRGPKNELWKIETDLNNLLSNLKKLFSSKMSFIILSGHSQGITPISLNNCIKKICNKGIIISKEMIIEDNTFKNHLPSGATCNWSVK